MLQIDFAGVFIKPCLLPFLVVTNWHFSLVGPRSRSQLHMAGTFITFSSDCLVVCVYVCVCVWGGSYFFAMFIDIPSTTVNRELKENTSDVL